MKVGYTNRNEHSLVKVEVTIEESPESAVPKEQRYAVYQAMDLLMTAVETAEHSRMAIADMPADTSVSGYYAAGADPQDVCHCYRTDAIDCSKNGCFCVEGQREWVEDIRSGCYDADADAAFEHELTLFAVGVEGLMVSPHGR